MDSILNQVEENGPEALLLKVAEFNSSPPSFQQDKGAHHLFARLSAVHLRG